MIISENGSYNSTPTLKLASAAGAPADTCYHYSNMTPVAQLPVRLNSPEQGVCVFLSVKPWPTYLIHQRISVLRLSVSNSSLSPWPSLLIIYPVWRNVSVRVHKHQSATSWHVAPLMSQLVSATPLFILNVSAVGDESRYRAIFKRRTSAGDIIASVHSSKSLRTENTLKGRIIKPGHCVIIPSSNDLQRMSNSSHV